MYHPTYRTIKRRGVAYAMSLLMLGILTSVAVSIHVVAVSELEQANGFVDYTKARLSAESGLAFIGNRIAFCASEPQNSGVPDMLEELDTHLQEKIQAGTLTMHGTGANRTLQLRGLPLGSEQSFDIDIQIAVGLKSQPSYPGQILVISTGRCNEAVRHVSVRFDVEESKHLLHYGLASHVRVIARGNAKVHGPISSDWMRIPIEGGRNKKVYPLDVQLSSDGYIEGDLETTMTAEAFYGDSSMGDRNFLNGISSTNPDCDTDTLRSKVSFEQPDVMNLDVADFDTKPLKQMTKKQNLPDPDETGVDLGMWSLVGSKWEGYDGVDDDDDRPVLNNILVEKGTNPHFKNCRFTGITYIEVDEDGDPDLQNGVLFEDCTFDGPVITGVPPEMRWDKNVIEFRGNTVFNGTMIQEALGGVTLMAPNFNVNIGGSEGGGGSGTSELVGLVIGGVVDLYNNLTIRGTVVSMAKMVVDGEIIMGQSQHWLCAGNVSGTNIGNLDGSGSVEIWPDPDNVMPLGMKKRYTFVEVADSYREYDTRLGLNP